MAEGKPSMRLQIDQRQSLVMTPQLQQSIKLLQMASADLLNYVEQQVLENPFLEMESENQEVTGRKEAAAEQQDVVDYAAKSTLSREDKGFDSDDSTHWKESASPGAMEESGYRRNAGMGNGGESTGNLWEQTLANEQTLYEHLREQWQVEADNLQDQLIGMYMIDLLDESGYLYEPLEAIAENLGCELEEVERILIQLQTSEPAGVFARDLKECMTLQLKEKGHFDPVAEAVLEHLELLGQGEITKLAKTIGYAPEDVQDVLQEIRSLHPKPGFQYDHSVVQAIAPDVVVKAQKNGIWHVYLNNDNLPRVLVDQAYSTEVSSKANVEEKHYVSEQLQHANWLVKALHQRAETTLKVAKALVKHQEKFLKYGVRYLKPMTLRMIAEEIEMHESTVSRVTSNRYIQTPRGLFELKYFFTSALGSKSVLGDEDVSSLAVKEQIKRLIEQEEKILSDEKLAQILQKQGIDIARRTVAKYRESLGIGSSTERRKKRKMSGS